MTTAGSPTFLFTPTGPSLRIDVLFDNNWGKRKGLVSKQKLPWSPLYSLYNISECRQSPNDSKYPFLIKASPLIEICKTGNDMHSSSRSMSC